MEQEHKRRVRYKGTHPRSYQEKYKELNPEKYQSDVEKIIRSGKLYKYFICVDEKPQTPKQNLQKVKKKFPDCFIVVIEGESVKRFK